MKKVIFIIISFTLLLCKVNAQDYHQVMLTGIAKMDSAKTLEQWQDAAGHYERIAAVDTTKWLPQYYAAYTNIMVGLMQKKDKAKDAFYDKSATYIARIEKMNVKNDEVLLLKSFLLQMQIAVNPMKRGKELGPQSDALLEEANKKNPDNPRYYLLKAENLYYTPPMFGGDKVKACENYQLAKDKFVIFKPADDISPNWGLHRINEMLIECSKEKK
jgi:hypothetical protein